MSAPFQPGDVVVCVDDHPELPPEPWQPARGKYYRIFDSFLGYSPDDEEGWAVELEDDPFRNGDGYAASDFRKIDDEQIPEVLERLKALTKPKEKLGLHPSRHHAYKREGV